MQCLNGAVTTSVVTIFLAFKALEIPNSLSKAAILPSSSERFDFNSFNSAFLSFCPHEVNNTTAKDSAAANFEIYMDFIFFYSFIKRSTILKVWFERSLNLNALE